MRFIFATFFALLLCNNIEGMYRSYPSDIRTIPVCNCVFTINGKIIKTEELKIGYMYNNMRRQCTDNKTAVDNLGSNLLCYVVFLNEFELLEKLAKDKKQLDHKNSLGWTPLHFAAQWNNEKSVACLLQNGAVIDIANSAGDTALLVAARFNCVRAMEVLYKFKPNINHQNKHGLTALHIAAGHNCKEAVKWLLEHGINKELTCQKGFTAEKYAESFDNHDVADYIDLFDLRKSVEGLKVK